jgi:hypothetical protein
MDDINVAEFLIFLAVVFAIGVFIYFARLGKQSRKEQSVNDFVDMAAELRRRSPLPVITKSYTGTQDEVRERFDVDARALGLAGYVPTYQAWAPDRTLTVTYELRATPDLEKACPMCAERIKEAALVCRFCGHKFGP